MNRKVSIVLPTYNQAHYLLSALDGVFTQAYPNYELIVVNDGSTDNTREILIDYQRRHSLRVIEQQNQGLPKALNAGFACATGDYLTWTSSDNIMLPDMLRMLADALDQAPAIGLVYADRYFITDAGINLGRFDLPEYDASLLLHVNLVHCCFLYRRMCMDRIGLYDPEFIYGEDWEYWIRMSQYYRMQHVPGAFYEYRLHDTSMTSELLRGTARNLGYQEFSSRMRRRLPLRWYIGKMKWRWLRLTNPQHPAVAGRADWTQAAKRAAQLSA